MGCGTLCQLKKLINRKNAIKDPSKSVALGWGLFPACCWIAHPCCSHEALQYDVPWWHTQLNLFPKKSLDLYSLEQRRIFMLALQEMSRQFVDLNIIDDEVSDVPQPESEGDGALSYACEVISLGISWSLMMPFEKEWYKNIALLALLYTIIQGLR